MDKEIINLLKESFNNKNIKLGSRILTSLTDKEAKLLILTSDISVKQSELYKNVADDSRIPYITVSNNVLSESIFRINHYAAVIISKNEANKILRCYRTFFNQENQMVLTK